MRRVKMDENVMLDDLKHVIEKHANEQLSKAMTDYVLKAEKFKKKNEDLEFELNAKKQEIEDMNKKLKEQQLELSRLWSRVKEEEDVKERELHLNNRELQFNSELLKKELDCSKETISKMMTLAAVLSGNGESIS
jgi:chromosome segregation ATPase